MGFSGINESINRKYKYIWDTIPYMEYRLLKTEKKLIVLRFIDIYPMLNSFVKNFSQVDKKVALSVGVGVSAALGLLYTGKKVCY